MPLRDDDLMASLRMAASVTSGEYRLGHETVIELGDEDESWTMVARHELAHLDLNLMTSFGVVLRVVAGSRSSDEHSAASAQLAGLVSLCRQTHEVVATTTGVWWTTRDHEAALRSYPSYRDYLAVGTSLANGLLPGSYAALAAVYCAGLACMQAPLGTHLDEQLPSAASLPRSVWPDSRLTVLRQAKLRLDAVEVEVPEQWLSDCVVGTDILVADHQRVWGRVASAYYGAFAALLDSAEMPCQPYDEVDPAVIAWATRRPEGHQLEVRNYQAVGATGPEDPYWLIAASDRERVRLHRGRRLIAVHLSDIADLPTSEDPLYLGHLVGGPRDAQSALIIVRPLRALLREYAPTDGSRALLAAAASGGVVTAVRVELMDEDELVTFLVVLSSVSELGRLMRLVPRLGVLASIAISCAAVPEWADYWMEPVSAATYATVLYDLPRRQLLDVLEREDCRVIHHSTEIHREAGPSIFALALHLPEFEVFPQAPQLVIGSEHTVRGLVETFEFSSAIRSRATNVLAADRARCDGVLTRLINEEPAFDAMGAADLSLEYVKPLQ